MKTATEKEIVKIPIEILLDACKMIYQGDLQNKIISSNEAMGEVILEIKYRRGNKIQQAAMNNIYESINEWNQLRYGEENPENISLA